LTEKEKNCPNGVAKRQEKATGRILSPFKGLIFCYKTLRNLIIIVKWYIIIMRSKKDGVGRGAKGTKIVFRISKKREFYGSKGRKAYVLHWV